MSDTQPRAAPDAANDERASNNNNAESTGNISFAPQHKDKRSKSYNPKHQRKKKISNIFKNIQCLKMDDFEEKPSQSNIPLHLDPSRFEEVKEVASRKDNQIHSAKPRSHSTHLEVPPNIR